MGEIHSQSPNKNNKHLDSTAMPDVNIMELLIKNLYPLCQLAPPVASVENK